MDVAVRNQIITELYDCYKANGFIAEDEALSLFTAHSVPLHQIDSITEQLLAMGVIITADDDEDDELFEDRSRTDYEAVYNEIIDIYPELEPVIEYLRNIARPLRNEWQKLMPHAQNGNEYARQRLFEMYLRVSARQSLYLSKKYHLPIEDTLQDGFVGAISSVDNYNPAEHMSYATTIQWRINQSILRNRYIYNNPAYFPIHIRDKLFDIMLEVEEHHCEDCPYNSEGICGNLVQIISENHHWTRAESETNIRYLKCWTSLESILESRGDVFDDDNLLTANMDEALCFSQVKNDLNEALQKLKKQQQKVLTLRFGLEDGCFKTLEEVGSTLHVTRERVRQIEKKALQNIKKILQRKKIWW